MDQEPLFKQESHFLMRKPPLPKRPKSMNEYQINQKIESKKVVPRSALDNYENMEKNNGN